MTQTLLTIVADLELSLTAAVSVGATTATLSTATDADGVALPSGKYGFTIDGDNSAKEFIVADLVGTALTGILSVTKQGATSSGFANYHRVGATVTITDWVVLKRMMNNLDGSVGFDAGNPINYDAEPSYSDPLTIPTVQFVLDTASGGTVTFDAEVIAGDAGETVADGEWVYLNTADGEWYLTDADDSAKSMNVKIGKARGAGTNGNPIVGGVFTAGLEKVGTYTPGQAYYLSNTAGALSTSAGTNSVLVGYGDANSELIMNTLKQNQMDASVGGGAFGTPSSSNKFMTQTGFQPALEDLYDAITYPTVAATNTAAIANSTAISVTAPSGTSVGDLLVLFLDKDSLTGVTGGYTAIDTSNTEMAIYAKIADGSDTFAATGTSGTVGWAAVVYRITGYWSGLTLSNIVFKQVGSGGTLSPENQYTPYLWLAATSHSSTGTVTAAPANYSGLITASSNDGDAGERNMAVAQRNLRAIYTTPGSFSTSGTINSPIVATVAIKAGASYLLT